MLDQIIQKDIELLIFLNNLGTVQWDGFWLFMTNKFSAIPLYILLLIFTYKTFGLKKTLFILLFVGLLIGLSDQTSNLFKYGFRRLRPCHNEGISGLIRLVKPSCGGKYSYFSAHASNAFSVAILFGLLLKNSYKYLIYILVIWAIIVAYSRVYIGVHFPLDIITGAFIGTVYALIIYKLLQFFGFKIFGKSQTSF